MHELNERQYCLPHGPLPFAPTASSTLKPSHAVAFLEHTIKPFLFYRQAMFPFPDYMLALAFPHQDPFSARLIHELNGHEWHVEEVYAQALAKACSAGPRAKVLDMGANVGHTMALAASLGCSVVGYELQPRLHRLINVTITANGWNDRVFIRAGAGTEDGMPPVGPKEYTHLSSEQGYLDVNNFPHFQGDCASPDGVYCERPVSVVNVLRDFDQDLAFVKLDMDSSELVLLRALVEKMKATGLKIANVVIEGNNPQQIATRDTALFEMCDALGFHAFVLDSPANFYGPVAHLLKLVKNRGFIGHAYYVPDAPTLEIVIEHVRAKFSSRFVGNFWLTSDPLQVAELVG